MKRRRVEEYDEDRYLEHGQEASKSRFFKRTSQTVKDITSYKLKKREEYQTRQIQIRREEEESLNKVLPQIESAIKRESKRGIDSLVDVESLLEAQNAIDACN